MRAPVRTACLLATLLVVSASHAAPVEWKWREGARRPDAKSAITLPGTPRSLVDRADEAIGPQLRLMYVLPSDGVDESMDTDGRIATSAAAFNRWLLNQTGSLQFRIDTFGGLPDIGFFRLSRTDAQMRAQDPFIRDVIESDLRAAGLVQDGKLYAVYYGGTSGYSCGGGAWPPALPGNVGAMYLKGQPPGAPGCDTNPVGAALDNPGYIEFGMLHELVHTLGFVAPCAPHERLSGHVSDSSSDLMWGGSEDYWHLPPLLDVGRDDYFDHAHEGCADLLDSDYLAVAPRAADDFNGDARSDILYRNTSTGHVYRLFMAGLHHFGGAIAYSEPDLAWEVVGSADFNGDGVADLVWRHSGNGHVYVMPFTGTGMPAAGAIVHTEPNSAWKILFQPDIDGDGNADLLWWNSATGQVYVMLLDGASVIAQGFAYTEPDTQWQVVGVGDFSGSGASNQLLWRHAATGYLYQMTLGFTGSAFTQAGAMIYHEPDTAWKVVGVADFTGEGRSDIAWRHAITGQVYVMPMVGAAVQPGAVVHTEANPQWQIVAFGDYDGDGHADLLWRNLASGHVYMMLMDGLTAASQAMVYTEPDTQWKVMGPYEYAP